jgi:phage tail protein X
VAQYVTRDGDTVDLVVWRIFGTTAAGLVERVLETNPGIADRGPVLPAGLVLQLPEAAAAATTVDQGVKLWD